MDKGKQDNQLSTDMEDDGNQSPQDSVIDDDRSVSVLDDIMEEENDSVQPAEDKDKAVYLPGVALGEDEFLEHDPSAYVMLHRGIAGVPCLSFDIIQDDLGSGRNQFPHTMYLVAGSQAKRTSQNAVIVMKLYNLQKTREDDSEEESSSDEDEDQNPIMKSSLINHYGCVNRIRSTIHNNTVMSASWSEDSNVRIYDLKSHLQNTDNTIKKGKFDKKKDSRFNMRLKETKKSKPAFKFSGHTAEGFAIDWSPTEPGMLATGDCDSKIYIWTPNESGWTVDLRSFDSHEASVEDIQWSPNDKPIFSSCSVDKSVRIWDVRSPQKCQLVVKDAHSTDVNVISWNKHEPLILSGGDDAYLNVWDIRYLKDNESVASFKYHSGPITSVEWNPLQSERSVFIAGSEDNQITIWDLAVERDTENNEQEIKEIPAQLLFIHMGEESVKEVHWHPQIPGVIVSTAENGFSIFQTINSA